MWPCQLGPVREGLTGLRSQAYLMKHEQGEDEGEGALGRETEVVRTEG